jgi:hypothetical protein
MRFVVSRIVQLFDLLLLFSAREIASQPASIRSTEELAELKLI